MMCIRCGRPERIPPQEKITPGYRGTCISCIQLQQWIGQIKSGES